jgi:parvulin-like peptidyl-prolyl isomerase
MGADGRAKAAALERAQGLMSQATTDFAEAVKKGDPGSVANAGRISRGVLEPTLEYVLFTMKKGDVFPEPLDTPRGYWILRRID